MLAPAVRRPANFSLLWFGEGVSVLGNATTSVLIPLLAVVHLHAGPAWLGAITAAAWLPWLIIGLPAGAWVDRLPPRAVMIVADVVSAVALFSVPVAWRLGALGLGQLVVVALVGGTATVFFRSAYVKLLPLIVENSQLESANARLFGTESAMQVVGPGVAGVLAQAVSAVFGIVLDAASFLVSAACLLKIRPATQPTRSENRAKLSQQIAEGITAVTRDRNLRTVTIIGGLSNFGLTGYGTLLVLYLNRTLELSSAATGVALAVGSVGGLLGATIATRLANRIGTGRASTITLTTGGPAALLIGTANDRSEIAITVLGLVLVGMAVVAGNVIRAAWRQRYVPAELMARVVTASQVVNYGTMPVAALAAGWLGGHLGIRPTIELMAGIHCLACLSVLATRFGRSRTLPTTAPSNA